MSRNWPALDLSPSGQTWDNIGMEQMIDRLREIGVSQESIDALRGEDENDVREYALLLIAMFDDRHEYVA
jgi:hypothetical protein